jgi:ERF superfamily
MNEITPANGALMSFIERAAKDDSFDVAKFGELLRLQRDVGHDQSRRAFNQGMADAQSEMLPVVRDAKNSHLGNKYAKLETIDAAMRPIYTRHGFSVRFGSAPAPTEGYIRITCTVAHAGGYFEENYLDAPIANLGSQGGRTATTGVQAVGSAVTYLRRYLLGMVFNIVLADEDDDGEGMRRAAPMQRVAAATPRAPRKADPEVYEADPAQNRFYRQKPADESTAQSQRTDEQWEVWVAKLRAACAVMKHRQEVVEIGNKPSVGDAIRDAPDRFKRDIDAILAEAFERFPTEPGDDLDEVEIKGQEKLAAG